MFRGQSAHAPPNSAVSKQQREQRTEMRDRSGSGSTASNVPPAGFARPLQASKSQSPYLPSSLQPGHRLPLQDGQCSPRQGEPQGPTASLSSSIATVSHDTRQDNYTRFVIPPISVNELLHLHNQSTDRALSALVHTHNTVLADFSQERVERYKLKTENAKIWSMMTTMQRDRDASQRDLQTSLSANREVQNLTSRIIELEQAMRGAGVSIPLPGPNRLSPVVSDISDFMSADGTRRRPSPGPRSASDTGPSLQAAPAARATGRFLVSNTSDMSTSTSTMSFASASSEPRLSASSSASSRFDLGNAAPHKRDIRSEREITPVASSSSTPNMQAQAAFANSPIVQSDAWKASSRLRASVSLNNALDSISSGSDRFSSVPATPQVHMDHDYTADTTVPAIGNFAAPLLSADTASSSSRGMARSEHSDHPSTEHLRVIGASPVPSSPAASVHSRISSHQSNADSPRSPRWPATTPPLPPSVLGRASESPEQNRFTPQNLHAQRFMTMSVSGQPVIHPERKLSRKGSSLDLTAVTKGRSPVVPLRSATPPAGVGNTSPMASLPTSPLLSLNPTSLAAAGSVSNAAQILKTPSPTTRENTHWATFAANSESSGGSNPQSLFSTPLIELPDEARRFILAQNNGHALPSPRTPFSGEASLDSTSAAQQHIGGLGIKYENGNAARTEQSRITSHLRAQQQARRASSALQASTMRGDNKTGVAEVLGHASPYMDERPVIQAVDGHLQSSGRSFIANAVSVKDHSQRMNLDSDHDADLSGSESLRKRASSQDMHPNVAQLEDTQNAVSGQERGTPARSGLQQASQTRRNSGRKKSGSFTSTSTARETGHDRKYLQLTPDLLHVAQVEVINSALKAGDRSNRETVHFLIRVTLQKSSDNRTKLSQPGILTAWLIEKAWIDIQSLDIAIKTKNSKGHTKKLPTLPDRNLFRDHAPARVDQRKTELQRYLQGLTVSRLPELSDLCAFLSESVVSDRPIPVSQPGYKAGYLTKRGRNLGGWTTRYYVLHSRHLEYSDFPGGVISGSIDLKGADIGSQKSHSDSERYRHAFHIRSRDRDGDILDHILCAESDEERDAWIQILICWTTGAYVSDTIAKVVPRDTHKDVQLSMSSSRTTSKYPDLHTSSHRGQAQRKHSQDPGTLRSQTGQESVELATRSESAQARPHPANQRHRREDSAGQTSVMSSSDEPQRGISRRRPQAEVGTSASISSGLDQCVHSERLGNTHVQDKPHSSSTSDKDAGRTEQNRSLSPEKRIKISAPSGGALIGSDFKRPAAERRAKVKSSFWDFASRRGNDRTNPNVPPARPVFGVPIQEAVDIARVREDSDLPAVVFRCVQYLSSVKAEEEEGIYRLSGSSAVIKSLKDRFNAEGDVDLTSEYYDPHAVAGLLKQFFRELPVHIFTNELNPAFVRANEISDERGKIREVCHLVQQLPVANYSALRFLSAHLVNVTKQEVANKMSIRNMGIVFSPTLAIPSTLFSLFITEFDRIFREVEAVDDEADGSQSDSQANRPPRSKRRDGVRRRSRNSKLFTQSGADRLLEVVSDFDMGDSPAEDDELAAPGKRQDTHRSASPALSVEDGNCDRHHRHNNNLTIDVAMDRASPAPSSQPRSPLNGSAASPRHLHAPLRSPGLGLPTSPRDVQNFPRR